MTMNYALHILITSSGFKTCYSVDALKCGSMGSISFLEKSTSSVYFFPKGVVPYFMLYMVGIPGRRTSCSTQPLRMLRSSTYSTASHTPNRKCDSISGAYAPTRKCDSVIEIYDTSIHIGPRMPGSNTYLPLPYHS
jgi:hypothetical protein